jgi:cytidylate kinase
MLTGKEWTDARQYDLSIDTGKIGVDNGVQLILQYLELV